MATGPHNIYNKASGFQMRSGTLLAADFTSGVAASVFTGLGKVHAAYACLNAVPSATVLEAMLITVDINSDGTIDVREFDIAADPATSAEADCTWIVVGT